MLRYPRRHGHLEIEHDVEEDDEPEAALCASAVSGREPPAGWIPAEIDRLIRQA
ncbi:hypothetical protein [Sorangium atrum]|uniref:Uncharacterized protein n=1 Tax=Sorangium atrum TaxID=2995308 RepID=A0ABT5BW82_9BACT|nr:hypothetical protein [Sorangium aterium]MDC0677759.1 hypothetical protein [Sorangium aterium]